MSEADVVQAPAAPPNAYITAFRMVRDVIVNDR